MAKVKAHELRLKKKEELVKQLDELKQELASLRVAQVTGKALVYISLWPFESFRVLVIFHFPSVRWGCEQAFEDPRCSQVNCSRSYHYKSEAKGDLVF